MRKKFVTREAAQLLGNLCSNSSPEERCAKTHAPSACSFESMTTYKKVAILAVILTVWSVVHAKGIFQAEGKIAELQMNQDAISFKFSGRISFGYATAPDTHPKRQWKDVDWEATNITVSIGDWTKPYRPSERADHPDTERCYTALLRLMKAGDLIQFSLDNPSLSFSNTGQLIRVSGTQMYARETGK